MKIIMISKLSPFAGGGGLERVVKDLLSIIGHYLQAKVMVTYMVYGHEKKATMQLDKNNITLIPILVPKVKVLDVLLYNAFAGFLAYRERCDIIHTHGECGAGYAILRMVFRGRTPQIHTFHGTWYQNILSRINEYEDLMRPLVLVASVILSWLEMIAGKESTIVTVVSNSVKLEVTKYYKIDPKKIIVINNGVNLSVFKSQDKSESRKLLSLEEEPCYGLFVGSDLIRKGFKLASEVFRELQKLGNYKLIVIGASRGRVKGFLGDCPDFICPFDRITDQQMMLVYNSSNFLLFLSEYEGFSLTPIEALSCGTLVIMLEKAKRFDSEGVIVCKNRKEVVASILGLRDTQLYEELCRSAKSTARRFSIQTLYQAYTDLYTKIVNVKIS